MKLLLIVLILASCASVPDVERNVDQDIAPVEGYDTLII